MSIKIKDLIAERKSVESLLKSYLEDFHNRTGVLIDNIIYFKMDEEIGLRLEVSFPESCDNELTVNEAAKLKVETEGKILNLVEEFQKKTGVEVGNLTLSKYPSYSLSIYLFFPKEPKRENKVREKFFKLF